MFGNVYVVLNYVLLNCKFQQCSYVFLVETVGSKLVLHLLGSLPHHGGYEGDESHEGHEEGHEKGCGASCTGDEGDEGVRGKMGLSAFSTEPPSDQGGAVTMRKSHGNI